MTNIIEQFIVDNKIDVIEVIESGLNGAFVILSGFALHKGIELDELHKSIDEFIDKEMAATLANSEIDELQRVYEYAASNNYSAFWKTEKAKKQYKF
jgi:hypothetical protein